MFTASDLDNAIIMAKGDYGVALPFTFSGPTFTPADELKLTVKNAAGALVLEKVYSNIQNNMISVELTSEESALLPPGNYIYGIDWYQNGAFQCNLLPVSRWAVMNKV